MRRSSLGPSVSERLRILADASLLVNPAKNPPPQVRAIRIRAGEEGAPDGLELGRRNHRTHGRRRAPAPCELEYMLLRERTFGARGDGRPNTQLCSTGRPGTISKRCRADIRRGRAQIEAAIPDVAVEVDHEAVKRDETTGEH
jgi:hypothetical protein